MPRAHLLIILLLAIVISAPLFTPGFYTSHDGENHLIRIAHFSQALRRSQLLPGWIDELNNHHGYPIFYFVYPFPYYLASAGHLLGLTTVNSLKTLLLLCNIISALFFYSWIFSLTKSKLASLCATLLFLFTPYRFLNLYVRVALGEIVFLSLLPAAFYFLETKRYLLFILTSTALLLSHLQLSPLFLPILTLYALIRKRTIIPLIASLFVSCFFWLPAISLSSLTKFPLTTQFSPQDHLPSLKQLIYSPWGFGFSHPGPLDGMSFQLGAANWLVLLISSFLIFRLTLPAWLAILFLVTSPFNFWQLEPAKILQFPWRLLAIPLVLTPLLLGLIAPKLPKVILLAFLIIAIYTNRNHIRTNLPDFTHTPDSYFLRSDTTTTATPDEFMPIVNKSQFVSHPSIVTARTISLTSSVLLLAFCLLKSNYALDKHYHQKL